MMPDDKESQTWLIEHRMVKAGYSLESLQNMESDRYDFISALVLKDSNNTNNNLFKDGI